LKRGLRMRTNQVNLRRRSNTGVGRIPEIHKKQLFGRTAIIYK